MIDRTLVVDEHGRLSCPRQGDVDADVCFSCPDLRGWARRRLDGRSSPAAS